MVGASRRAFGLALVVGAVLLFSQGAQAGSLGSGLAAKMTTARSSEAIPVIVQFPNGVTPSVGDLTGKDRVRAVAKAAKAQGKASSALLRSDLAQRQANGDVSDVTDLWLTNGVAMKASAGTISSIMAKYPNAQVTLDRPLATPTVSPLGNITGSAAADDWGLIAIQAPDMWAAGYRGQDVVVAVMDTGMDALHPAIANGAFEGGANSWCDTVELNQVNPVGGTCPGVASPTESTISGHGTGVASVLFGDTVSDTVVSTTRVRTGVAPDARWVGVRVFDNQGNAKESDAIKGLQWLASLPNPPQVLNLSWRVDVPADGTCIGKRLDAPGMLGDPLRNALAILRNDMDVFVVAAAGNSRVPVLPAAFHEVYAVGASGPDNTVWADNVTTGSGEVPTNPNLSTGMNCRGRDASLSRSDMVFKPYPDALAPGENVAIAAPSGGGQVDAGANGTGTSYSAPYAAGAAALLLSAFPDMTAADLERVLSLAAANAVITPAIAADPAANPAVLAQAEVLQVILDNTRGYGLLKAHDSLLAAMQKEVVGAVNPTDDYMQMARAPQAWLTQMGSDVVVHWDAPPVPAGVTVNYVVTKNGVPLAGSPVTTLSITDTGAAPAAVYKVTVADAAGVVPTSAATVAMLGNVNKLAGATAYRVDGFDLVDMAAAVAIPGGSTNMMYDLDGSTVVDAADMTILKAQMGKKVMP